MISVEQGRHTFFKFHFWLFILPLLWDFIFSTLLHETLSGQLGRFNVLLDPWRASNAKQLFHIIIVPLRAPKGVTLQKDFGHLLIFVMKTNRLRDLVEWKTMRNKHVVTSFPSSCFSHHIFVPSHNNSRFLENPQRIYFLFSKKHQKKSQYTNWLSTSDFL